LHRAARSLERRLGLPLFEHTSFGIRATRDGERLARHARLAFAELAQARAEIAALGGHDSGRTVIGVLPLARSFLVPQAVLGFTAAHPHHTVELLDGSYEHLLAALRAGEADLLVGALRLPAPAPDVREEPLFDDPLALVVRVGHPLAGRRRVTVRTLLHYPWIAPRRGAPLRQRFVELFAAAGQPTPSGLIECNSFLAARSLLRHSDRVMLLSAHQIEEELAAGLLTTLPHPSGLVSRCIGFSFRERWQPTAAQQDLLARLRAAAAGIRSARIPSRG
jgi:DNA-binding transcriptional LysR family regulator